MAIKPPAKKQGTSVINWEQQLEQEAAIAAKQEESTSTGAFFGLKSGVLTWEDNPVKGNEMVCVILDSVLENVYYEGTYSPDTPQSPTCYAFGRDDSIHPHPKVVEQGKAQHDKCTGCQWNEYGTANVGKGKACRNTRRLAIIVAGTPVKGDYQLFEDIEQFEDVKIGFMKLPVTSTKAFAGYVKTLAGAMKRPPHGVITRIIVSPDPKNQFKVEFEAYSSIPNELMGVIMERRKEAVAAIEFPYAVIDESEKKPAKSKAAQKPATKGAQRRKY